MSGPKEIFLQPECCADPDVGRLWCEDDAPIDCEDGNPWTRYVRADEIERLTGLVSIYKQRDGQILDLQRELAAREIDLSHAALPRKRLSESWPRRWQSWNRPKRTRCISINKSARLDWRTAWLPASTPSSPSHRRVSDECW